PIRGSTGVVVELFAMPNRYASAPSAGRMGCQRQSSEEGVLSEVIEREGVIGSERGPFRPGGGRLLSANGLSGCSTPLHELARNLRLPAISAHPAGTAGPGDRPMDWPPRLRCWPV